MSRFLPLLFLTLAVSACRVPPDHAPLRPLPEEGQVYTYPEILGRARLQAQAALEAFYVDNWSDLEDVAEGLKQTARFLPKTKDIPAKHKEKLPAEATALGEDAVRLRDAARVKDVTQANDSLQRIHLKIRTLRPDPPPAPKAPEKE